MRRAKKRELGTADPIGRGLFSNSLPNVTSDVTASNGMADPPPGSNHKAMRSRSLKGAQGKPCAFAQPSVNDVPPRHQTVATIPHLGEKSDNLFFTRRRVANRLQMLYSLAHGVCPWPTVA
jgi:hypothetical protein